MTHCRIHGWYIIQFFSKGLSRVELELAHFFSFISTLGKCVFNGPPQWTLIQTPQEPSNIPLKKPLKGPPSDPQKLFMQPTFISSAQDTNTRTRSWRLKRQFFCF